MSASFETGLPLPADVPRPANSPAVHESPGWLPVLFAGLCGLHLAVAIRLGLHVDEAYYWEWSRRLDLSYFDHPPMVAWLLRLSTALLGQTELAVHLPAAILVTATSLVLMRLVALLYPGRRRLAWASAVVFNCVPLFGMGAVFTTPDAPLALCWVATIYFVRVGLDARRWGWYAAGLTAGLGLLSKYNMVLLPPAIFLYLLSSRHRSWLRRREPYLALGLMLLGFAPALVWNAQHDWVSFRFHLADRHPQRFAPLRNVGRFALSQLTVSPLLLGLCVWGAVRGFRAGRRGDDASWYLLWCSSFVLAFFAVAGVFTLTLANWPALGYATLLVLGLKAAEDTGAHKLAGASVALAAAMTGAFYFQAVSNMLPLPAELDYTVDLHGWGQVGNKLRELRESMPSPERTFVFSHRFQFASMAAFYGGPDLEVTRIGGRHDQYDMWMTPAALRDRDAIFFCNDHHFRAPDGDAFGSCEPAGELPLMRAGRPVRTFFFWICRGYRGPPG